MDDLSLTLLTGGRISSLLRSSRFDREVLEDVQATLLRVESLLHQCSGTHSPGRGSAAGELVGPDASITSDKTITDESHLSADLHTAVSSQDDLPILPSNRNFDTPAVESTPSSTNTVTTIGQFFKYDLYAADQTALVDVPLRQEDTQRKCDQGYGWVNFVYEDTDEKDFPQEEETTTQGTQAFVTQEASHVNNASADECTQASLKEA